MAKNIKLNKKITYKKKKNHIQMNYMWKEITPGNEWIMNCNNCINWIVNKCKKKKKQP